MQYLAYLDDIMDILHYVAGLTTLHKGENRIYCNVCTRENSNHKPDCVVGKAQEMLENIARPCLYKVKIP
jgi:hypothetical protein